MDIQTALKLAGGRQSALARIFSLGGFTVTQQAVSLWVKKGKIPTNRIAALRRIKPSWFRAEAK